MPLRSLVTRARRERPQSIVSPTTLRFSHEVDDAPPIAATERYIAILLTTGSCRTKAITVEDDLPDSCHRRIFVGVGLSEPDARRPANKRRLNSWEACAADAIRDVRAWLTSNATRLRTLR
jgi:hypothetical protein